VTVPCTDGELWSGVWPGPVGSNQRVDLDDPVFGVDENDDVGTA